MHKAAVGQEVCDGGNLHGLEPISGQIWTRFGGKFVENQTGEEGSYFCWESVMSSVPINKFAPLPPLLALR